MSSPGIRPQALHAELPGRTDCGMAVPPSPATPTAPTAAAPVSVEVDHQASGLSVAINGHTLASDSASQLATLTMSGGHSTLNIGGLTSSAPVNLTIRGLPGDTININGALELGGGSLKVSGDMIHVSGSIHSAGGSVELNAGSQGTLLVSGRIDVSNPAAGQLGGSVQLLGARVGLLNGAAIDASGDAGGGSVLVGGDLHGANPSVLNAQQTYVDAGAQITARAIRSGQGGKVVIWADDFTQFNGTIRAQGGSKAGDGGTVEVSGRVASLLFNRQRRSFRHAHGHDGSLLLDPQTVQIVTAGSNDGAFSGGTITAGQTPNAMTISASTIVTLLATTSVSRYPPARRST